MAVEFGVLLPTREAVMSGRPETAPLLAIAERAEGAGFDSVWIGDSLTARPRHEPLTLLAAVAARTRRGRLRPGGVPPALRNPGRPAHAAGRAADAVTGAAYVTLALDPSPTAAEQRLHRFLESYYAAPARVILARQATYAGPIDGCVEWLQRWIKAGARHISLRFAGGDQLAQVDEAAARLLPRLQRA